MGSLANSEDPDEMPQNEAFHQRLHCLLWKNIFLRNTFFFNFKWSSSYNSFFILRTNLEPLYHPIPKSGFVNELHYT